MKKQEITLLLKRLIKTCVQGELGFQYGAQHVHSKELAAILLSVADNCRQGARELQHYVGGAVTPKTRASSTLQRARVLVSTLFAENVDTAILKECNRIEDAAVSEYGAAIQEVLPNPLRDLLERQYRGAKCNANRIHDLLLLQQVVGATISYPRLHVAETRESLLLNRRFADASGQRLPDSSGLGVLRSGRSPLVGGFNL